MKDTDLTATCERLDSIRRRAVSKIVQCGFDQSGIDKALQELVEHVCARLISPFDEAIIASPPALTPHIFPDALRGQQLLRFAHNSYLRPHHKGLEKVFEKYLIKEEATSSEPSEFCWANQIPLCAGITRRADGGVSIDLGYKDSDTVFRLYELKTGDVNDPLYALLELFTYALSYMIIRRIAPWVPKAESAIRKRSKGLLDATRIRWILLGTPNFYLRKLRGGGFVSAIHLETVRVATQNVLKLISQRFELIDLELTVEVRQLAADLPKIAPGQQEKWLKQITGDSTLRGAVLQAKQLLT